MLIPLLVLTFMGQGPAAPAKAVAFTGTPSVVAERAPAPEEAPFAGQLDGLRKRGAAGDLEAQAMLGVIFSMGVGVPIDLDEARYWLRQAADQGHPGAQVKLAAMCFLGEGMPVDLPQAVGWFRKAADQGEPHAQACLGVMFAAGVGVPQDLVEAYALLLEAQAGGVEDEEETLHQIKQLLTPSQIEDGNRRALDAIGKRNPIQA